MYLLIPTGFVGLTFQNNAKLPIKNFLRKMLIKRKTWFWTKIFTFSTMRKFTGPSKNKFLIFQYFAAQKEIANELNFWSKLNIQVPFLQDLNGFCLLRLQITPILICVIVHWIKLSVCVLLFFFLTHGCEEDCGDFFFLLGFDSEEKDTRSEPNLFDFEFAGLISPKR